MIGDRPVAHHIYAMNRIGTVGEYYCRMENVSVCDGEWSVIWYISFCDTVMIKVRP